MHTILLNLSQTFRAGYPQRRETTERNLFIYFLRGWLCAALHVFIIFTKSFIKSLFLRHYIPNDTIFCHIQRVHGRIKVQFFVGGNPVFQDKLFIFRMRRRGKVGLGLALVWFGGMVYYIQITKDEVIQLKTYQFNFLKGHFPEGNRTIFKIGNFPSEQFPK